MPYLRAALMPHKESPKERKKAKMAIRSLEDMKVALAVKAWLYADDLSTKVEAAQLGL
ncbi:MAG: hypothetical protein II877_02500 [Synergistaceae bacterium]|nr:hypothetical protein [Synergistaceae bacterium]